MGRMGMDHMRDGQVGQIRTSRECPVRIPVSQSGRTRTKAYKACPVVRTVRSGPLSIARIGASPQGASPTTNSPERRPMPLSCARGREIQTGGQRPLMARNLRIKHLGGPGHDGLPFLTGDGGHVWLHNGCHGDWTAQRRAEAVAALAILGLRPQTMRS